MGMINCTGSDTENAEVFHRVIQPEYADKVLAGDKDYRLALFFITLMSTILNLMQKDMMKDKKKGKTPE